MFVIAALQANKLFQKCVDVTDDNVSVHKCTCMYVR